MKSLVPILLMLAAGTSLAQAQAQGCAQVEVSNVRPQQGHLMLVAYADAESYNKKPLVQLRLPAGEAVMSFQVCGLAGSQVAFSLYQDLDSDGKFARNVLGIPTEPWGSSGTPGAFGPSWETGRVALDGKPIAVRLSQ